MRLPFEDSTTSIVNAADNCMIVITDDWFKVKEISQNAVNIIDLSQEYLDEIRDY